MSQPSPEKKAEWAAKAKTKGAIVPHFFEVFPNRVELQCGQCRHSYKRTLLMNHNDPTFACPKCAVKNWVPIKFDVK